MLRERVKNWYNQAIDMVLSDSFVPVKESVPEQTWDQFYRDIPPYIKWHTRSNSYNPGYLFDLLFQADNQRINAGYMVNSLKRNNWGFPIMVGVFGQPTEDIFGFSKLIAEFIKGSSFWAFKKGSLDPETVLQYKNYHLDLRNIDLDDREHLHFARSLVFDISLVPSRPEESLDERISYFYNGRSAYVVIEGMQTLEQEKFMLIPDTSYPPKNTFLPAIFGFQDGQLYLLRKPNFRR